IESFGYALGTLCVIDRVTRELEHQQVQALQALGRQVVMQFELRRHLAERERSIIERQRVEEALRESKNHLRAIIDAEPDCVKLVAADGTLGEMNPAGLAMIEVESADAAIGKSVYSLVAPEYREAFQALNESVCNGNKGRLEFEIVGCQGTRLWMETHAVPLLNESNGT
uniref:PAS domain-containing protein n=1 Tax=Staphylococcus aureus TaxID=1280 RepID=UPI0011551213